MNENSQTPLDANELQKRTMIEQVAEAAVRKFALDNPGYSGVAGDQKENAMGAGVKLAGGIIAALLTLGISGTAVWVVSSINAMQLTLARMETAQTLMVPAQEKRFADLETRQLFLENQQRGRKNAVN